MGVRVVPLTRSVGAEIEDVDLRHPLERPVVDQIRRAWDEYGVLVFRDQALSPEDQSRFTKYFGEPRHGIGELKDSEFVPIGNVAIDGIPGTLPTGELLFHQDGSYAEIPPRATFLSALEIPSVGGNTKFCSTARAYEALSPELRADLVQRDIRFVHRYGEAQRGERNDSDPRYTHPLVVAHPSTGRPLLFCNRLMAEEIVGLSIEHSDALITQLLAEVERSEYVYEHVWRVGDLVAWDNLAVQHARTDFDPTERRSLRRTQIMGAPLIAYRNVAEASR